MTTRQSQRTTQIIGVHIDLQLATQDYFCLILCSNLSAVCSFSYIISLDVLITVQSILNSFVLEKEIWGPKHLGLSGHKLLTTDLLQDAESGWQSNKVSDSSFLSSSVLYVLIRF